MLPLFFFHIIRNTTYLSSTWYVATFADLGWFSFKHPGWWLPASVVLRQGLLQAVVADELSQAKKGCCLSFPGSTIRTLLQKATYKLCSKWYISGIYCQLGDYMPPTTYQGNIEGTKNHHCFNRFFSIISPFFPTGKAWPWSVRPHTLWSPVEVIVPSVREPLTSVGGSKRSTEKKTVDFFCVFTVELTKKMDPRVFKPKYLLTRYYFR